MTKILIAASGSGGHLFPAVYIAKALCDLDRSIQISFVGSGRPLEGHIFRKAGDFPIHVVKIVGVKHRGIKGIFQFFSMLPHAVISTWQLIS